MTKTTRERALDGLIWVANIAVLLGVLCFVVFIGYQVVTEDKPVEDSCGSPEA